MKANCKIVMLVIAMMIVGAAMSGQPAGATIYANSETDFAGVSNDGHGNGWWYYEWPDPLDVAGTSPASAYTYGDVQLMTDWSSGQWHGSFGGGYHYPVIGARIIMPAGPNWPGYNLWAVRRWVSTVSGSVYIYGQLSKNDPYGNGVNAHIYVDGVEKWSQFCTTWDRYYYQINIPLTVGQNVDFAVDPNGDVSDDESIFTAVISSDPAPNGLHGTVTLSGFLGRLDLSPVEIVLSQSGVAQITKIITVTGTGDKVAYNIPNVPPGTYDVKFTAAHFLTQTLTGVVIEATSSTLSDVSLTNGDVNGDNYVGTDDFSLLSTNFDKTGN